MADTSEIEIEDTVDRDDASAGTANTDNEAKDTYVQPISKKNSKGVDNYPRMTGKQHKKSFFTNRAKEELLKPHESHAALFKRGIHQPEKAALSWSKKERQNAEKVRSISVSTPYIFKLFTQCYSGIDVDCPPKSFGRNMECW